MHILRIILLFVLIYTSSEAQIIPINHDMKNLKIGNTFLYRSIYTNFRTNETGTSYFYNRVIRFDTIAGKQYAVYQNGSKERADSSGVYWIPQHLDTVKPLVKEYLKYPLFPGPVEKKFELLACALLSSISCSTLLTDTALVTIFPETYRILGFSVRNFFFSHYSVGQYATILGVWAETINAGNTAQRITLCGALIEGKYYGDSACLVASSTPLQRGEFTALSPSLAPNPVSDIATLRFVLPTAQGLSIEICDMLGREVAPPLRFEALSSGMNALPIDVAGLARGVYAVRLRTAIGLRATTMLVKQ